MPRIKEDLPKPIAPYISVGIDLQKSGSDEWVAECPFCGREKFSVNQDSGQWRCLACNHGSDNGKVNRGGNVITLMKLLLEESQRATTEFKELLTSRRIVLPDTPSAWGVCRSLVTGDWVVPAHTSDGRLCNLYRYAAGKGGKRLLYATKDQPSGLFGRELYDPKCETVYLAEGPWDAMALWEILGFTKRNGNKLTFTGNKEASLLTNACVLAVPGAGTFDPSWASLFSGKRLVLLYDNDHERQSEKNVVIPSAGYEGMRRVAEMLASVSEPPKTIEFLRWGEPGKSFNPDIPHQYDIRDFLTQGNPTQEERVQRLAKLLSPEWIHPIPPEWVAGRSVEAKKTGSLDLASVPCSSWKALVNQWRKAMQWTEGLERGLLAGLACIFSTEEGEDQIWVRIIGPASCLASDTKLQYCVQDSEGRIINKKGGTIESLFRRFHGLSQESGGPRWTAENVQYLIQSVTDEGVVFRNRVTDVVDKGIQPVYKLITRTGKTIRATRDHEFLTPRGYVPLSTLKRGSVVMINHGKTQPKGQMVPNRNYRKEVKATFHPRARIHTVTTGGKKYQYACVYRYWTVYEAHMNRMSHEAYLDTINRDQNATRLLWTIPEGSEIHHIDEDPSNDDLNNLVLVDSKNHINEFHSDKAKAALAIIVEEDVVVSVEPDGCSRVYDIQVEDPYRNFVAEGIVVHNCGKSTLCEAFSVAKKYVYPKSTLRGFHSGYDDGSGENHSPLQAMKNKTLILKDGDTLLTTPNLPQLMAEARDVFDRVSRSSYRTKQGKDWEGLNITWILCGTNALHKLDSSELGERFITVVIMDGIDDAMEDQVNLRVADRVIRNLTHGAGVKRLEKVDKEMVLAKQMTGGFIEYLRTNSSRLLSELQVSEEATLHCIRCAKFVAYARARESTRQGETTEREFSARLVGQLLKFALCSAAVMGEKDLSVKVQAFIRRTALDSARGTNLEIMKHLFRSGDAGAEASTVANWVGRTAEEVRKALRFMRRIGAVDYFHPAKEGKRMNVNPRWRLSPVLVQLYGEVMDEEYSGTED